MAVFFSELLPCGTTMVTGMPSFCPAQARPAPWLPRVAAMTPRCRAASSSRVITDRALRTLKDCVGWWFSCFTNRRMPPPTSASSGA